MPLEPLQVEWRRTDFKAFLYSAIPRSHVSLPKPSEGAITGGMRSHEAGSVSIGESLMRADPGVRGKDASVLVCDFLCDEAGCPLELHDHLVCAEANDLTLEATQLMEPQRSKPVTSVLDGA